MNKADLVNAVKAALGDTLSKAQVEAAVNATIDAIKEGVKKDESVQLIGFGTFKVAKRQARNGINPKTKEPIKIKASKSVKFVPGKALKDEL